MVNGNKIVIWVLSLVLFNIGQKTFHMVNARRISRMFHIQKTGIGSKMLNTREDMNSWVLTLGP